MNNITHAIENPITNTFGRLVVTATLDKYGLSHSIKNITALKNGFSEKNKSTILHETAGLQFSEKNKNEFTKDDFKRKVIYKLVCKDSARFYVGYCDNPYVSRATLYFYLKNYWKYSSSNLFFGVLKLKEDVMKHGLDSFYFDIIQFVDNNDKKEIIDLTESIIKSTDPEKLYNRSSDERLCVSAFANIDKKSSKLVDEYLEVENELSEFLTNFEPVKAAYDQNMSNIVVDGLSKKEINEQKNKLREEIRNERLIKRNLSKKLLILKEKILKRDKELKLLYQNNSEPTY